MSSFEKLLREALDELLEDARSPGIRRGAKTGPFKGAMHRTARGSSKVKDKDKKKKKGKEKDS